MTNTENIESFIALSIGLGILLFSIFKMLYQDFKIHKERNYIEKDTTFIEYLRKDSLFSLKP